MNKRINSVIQKMKEESIDSLLINDSSSIDYLIEYVNHPGERLYALIIKSTGQISLLLNRLFIYEDNNDQIDVTWYSDDEDSIEILHNMLGDTNKLGIDKYFPAKFLLPLQAAMPEAKFVVGSSCVDVVRMVKDNDELTVMYEASRINDKAIHQAIALTTKGYSEQAIARELLDIYKSLGGEGYSFTPIIAYGKNCSNPHHENTQTKVKPGDSIIIDIGCYYGGYCSDMTRTVFYKEVSDEDREVYRIVKSANEAAIAAIKPGMRLCDIDKVARDIIEEKGYGKYFTHRLGHFIGKDVHEYGDVSSSFEMEVQPGMIFSIEPGIYLPGKMGVRIEDLVVVTDVGCKVLNNYPKDLFIVE